MEKELSLKIFGKILTFVHELKEVYPKEHTQLYYKLLKKTPIGNQEAIAKHVDIFGKFLLTNREAIVAKDIEKIEGDILVSKRVYLDMKKCLIESDTDTKKAILNHLQLILFLIHPDEHLKQAVKTIKNTPSEPDSKEEQFLSSFMNKIEENFSGEQFQDPMQATMKLMTSGVFTDMIQTLNQGVANNEIDVGRLLGSVQGMMGNLGGDSNDPQLGNIMQMATNMMSKLNVEDLQSELSDPIPKSS